MVPKIRLKISRKLLRKVSLMIFMVCSTLVAIFNILFYSVEHSVQHILAHAANHKHLQQLRKVLSKLRAKDLKLNLKKCEFGEASINYMGHFLTLSWTWEDGTKPPSNTSNIRCFSGLVNYLFQMSAISSEAISSPESWLCKVWRTGKRL